MRTAGGIRLYRGIGELIRFNLLVFGKRQVKAYLCAAPGPWSDSKIAFVGFNDRFDYEQAESRALLPPGYSFSVISLSEFLKESFLIMGVKAAARVAHRDAERPLAVLVVRFSLNQHLASVRSEFDSVGHKVCEHAAQIARISHDLAQSSGDLVRQHHALLIAAVFN